MASSVENWVDTVAERADVDEELVREVSERYGIIGPKMIPTRRSLKVEALHFAGVKNLADDKNTAIRRFYPFSFHRDFTTPVTAFVSNGKNDAGKSSTLEILKWGLRGSSEVAVDVQKWLRQVCVLLNISGERILVSWRVCDGSPSGQILILPETVNLSLAEFTLSTAEVMAEESQLATDSGETIFTPEAPVDRLVRGLLKENAFSVCSFEGNKQMKNVISDFMLQRLSLDTLTEWTRTANSKDLDDGKLASNGWPLWSQALAITKPSAPAVIGEVPFHARNVLKTFLATEWSGTELAARANKKAVDGQLAGIARRRDRDSKAREADTEVLRSKRSDLVAKLKAIPASGMTVEEVAAARKKLSAATNNLTQAQRAVAEIELRYGSVQHEIRAAQQDLAAFKEAAVMKRFWHSLMPSCCPRCDAKVEPEQWQQEQEGSCSLCNKPIGEVETGAEVVEDENHTDDSLDPVALAEQRVTQLSANLEELSTHHDRTLTHLKEAELEFEHASEGIQNLSETPFERQTLEHHIAVLDGRIEERSQPFEAEQEEATLAADSKVLGAVEQLATQFAKKDLANVLVAVSEQITILGKALGINNLEKATLQAGATLPVIKGGERINFGKLTDGEKLRLKIAVVVSLLDIGTSMGIGRHPGLLIVDSLATEELNHENGRLLLQELGRVAETYGLQVITSTAHSELVTSVLPSQAIQQPTAGDLMW